MSSSPQTRWIVTGIASSAMVVLLFSSEAARAALPKDFVDELVASGLSAPSSLAFVPGDRALVIEQMSAKIRMVKDGVVTTLVTVPNVRTGGERGLLGIAVDPQWPSRPYVYVHYDGSLANEIRISRFTITGDLDGTGAGDLAIESSSRYDILTGLPDFAVNHNGGTVRFAPDGMLYVSLGDDAVSCAAQDRTAPQGKILRLDVRGLPSGPGGPPARSTLAPADNPWVSATDDDEKLVWAYGLRNPFRFSVDARTGHLFVADVGESEWEEIDELATGGINGGWPFFEGQGAYGACGGTAEDLVFPIWSYPHNSDLNAIVMGPAYRSWGARSFPWDYEGDVFFSDYYIGDLIRLKRLFGFWFIAPRVSGQPSIDVWGTGYAYVPDYVVGPDGAIWYVSQSLGQLRRIAYSGTVSVPPSPMPAATNEPPKIYDLQGRRVDRPVKSGVYFVRGRRVVILK